MAENGANLPNEAQFDEFENEEVGAGLAHDEEGVAGSAVPEIPVTPRPKRVSARDESRVIVSDAM